MQALPVDPLTLTPRKSSFLSRLFLAIRRNLSIVKAVTAKEVNKEVTAVNAVKVAKVGKVFKIVNRVFALVNIMLRNVSICFLATFHHTRPGQSPGQEWLGVGLAPLFNFRLFCLSDLAYSLGV